MKNDVFILGAGGFAREVYLVLSRLERAGGPYSFGGFVDIDPDRDHLAVGDHHLPILRQADFLLENVGARVAIGTGDPALIARMAAEFDTMDFVTLVDPSVELHDSVRLGAGNIVTAGVQMTVNIEIGCHNVFNLNVTIGHDATIGNGNVINPGANISGGVTLGNGNLVGTGAAVLQNLSIGSNCTVGAAALVTKNISDEQLVVGVPGRARPKQ